MATLRDIKRRIVSVKSTAKITSAMKMVAAAKMKRAQNAIEAARPYVVKLEGLMSNLVGALNENYSNPLIVKRDDVKSVAIIVISSDRGLCGGFNNNLFKALNHKIETDLKKTHPDAVFSVIAVGRKSSDYYRKSHFNVHAKFSDVFSLLEFETARDIVSTVKQNFISGKFDKVYLFNNTFVNIIKQEPTLSELLPITAKETETDENSNFTTDYIYEPDMESILDVLIPKLVDNKVWRSLLESNSAEQAARMMAMDNATNNARDLIRSLELTYNKLRQEAITTEMLEIVGGAEALNG